MIKTTVTDGVHESVVVQTGDEINIKDGKIGISDEDNFVIATNSGELEMIQQQIGQKVDKTELLELQQKVDRLYEIIETGELSTSFERDFVETSKQISAELDKRYEEMSRKNNTL